MAVKRRIDFVIILPFLNLLNIAKAFCINQSLLMSDSDLPPKPCRLCDLPRRRHNVFGLGEGGV